MTSNVYTKSEILQALSAKGYFVDIYTLNTFFSQWHVEAIFEDEQGSEFFDKNALDLVLNNLFNTNGQTTTQQQSAPVNIDFSQPQVSKQPEAQPLNSYSNNIDLAEINDKDTNALLSGVTLSDGTPLVNKIQNNVPDIPVDIPLDNQILNETPVDIVDDVDLGLSKKKIGILEGAIQQTLENAAAKLDNEIPNNSNSISDFQRQTSQIVPESSVLNLPNDETPMPTLIENTDMEDMSLISDSLQVQEKLREYENQRQAIAQGNNPSQPSNEFKLDISERTISMIARTMAKKIAKHVSMICSADVQSVTQLEKVKAENKELEQKIKELESQNKKIRLLLAETNKNLSSYQPTIFGLYKKVPPKQ